MIFIGKTIFDILFMEFCGLLYLINKKIYSKFIHAYQKRKFNNIVKYAYNNSTFYQKKFLEKGINLEKIEKLNIEDFPVTSKRDFIKNISNIYTDKYVSNEEVMKFIHDENNSKLRFKENYICFTTSGSLGEKLPIIIHFKDFLTFILTMFYYNSKPLKFILGLKTKVAILGMTQGRSAAVTLIKNLSKKIYTTKEISIILPLNEIINELNNFMPDQVVSYPGVFLSLIEEKKLGRLKIKPKKIILSGEVLTDENYQKIQLVFDCEVVNSYGASECFAIAIKNSSYKDYRTFMNMCLIEILDINDKPVKNGELGKVVITNLYNFGQPFIRYDIGDSAIKYEDKYGNLQFKGVSGRNYKPIIFTNNDGKKEQIFHWSFYSLVIYSEGLIKTQLLVGEDCFKLKLVGNDTSIIECKQKFEKILADLNFEKSVKMIVEKVEDILPEKNGKIPFIKFEQNLLI
ncbi:hypothetical protein QEJ31_08220 [Pigmentibacter sp. JX0631]|uniref:hypothetical protein n=1 Tax=Pigmentibacter sp. JX0631 TaxID=2976982 RepID=UPI0024685839|nr:hypothetical protein [Pigmentibacter sp. JX0631]WGL58524.1 hypothetical protein QEJ31_08220 [Pigmentibacter sp. JX0631]